MIKKFLSSSKILKGKMLVFTFLFLFCLAIITTIFFQIIGSQKEILYTSISKNEKLNIIIDPGHGGFDNGASSNDINEKDINLEISLKLKDLFVSKNFNVIMTREVDDSTEKISEQKGINKKRADMKNRLNILNSNSNNIFISIHQNKYSDPDCNGAQIFYSRNNELGKYLAQDVQDSFRELQPDNKREIVEAKSNLFLLYKATVPAILVECGFLSNPEELKNLQDGEYQDKVAYVIFNGVEKFINENKN